VHPLVVVLALGCGMSLMRRFTKLKTKFQGAQNGNNARCHTKGSIKVFSRGGRHGD